MIKPSTAKLTPRPFISILAGDPHGANERFDALERKLSALYKNVPFGMHTLDKAGYFLSINRQELSWLGYTTREVVGVKKFEELLTLESQERYQRYQDNYRLHGLFLCNIELSLIANNGKIRNVVLYSEPILDGTGMRCVLRCVLFDITERKAIEADLQIAAAAFETQEGIFITDAHNMILRVNKAFTDITGYSAEDVLGRNPNILSSGRHDASFYSEMWGHLNSSGKWSGEMLNRRKSGELYPEFLSISTVKDQDGIIINYVATLTDISSINAAAEEIKNLAFYDQLTQIPNRRLFIDRLTIAMSLSARTGESCALLFLDLDHFKTLNDMLGHDMGDLLLHQVAKRLIQCVREGDTVARLGGDEFVVLLVGLSHQPIEHAATTLMIGEKITTAMNKPFQLKTCEYHITISTGITLFSGQDQPMEELMKQADIAMYQSKAAGRNTLRFFDPKMQQTITDRVTLEHELVQALKLDQFTLYYQVQVDDSNNPIGAEALIRWFHPERGMMSPLQFITIAEENKSLIIAIGQWVLNTVCAQLKAWEQNALTRELTLSINVSAKEFHNDGFATTVKSTLRQYDVNPKRLKLELTESLLVDNIEKIILTLGELKEIGVHFELDDFGTGYSSLQYLKKLPLHQLKIDQSFIRDITTDISDQEIVRTIIAMAQSLGLGVIAEGVETEEQRLILFTAGCKNFQGYLFGRPMPVDQLEKLLNLKTT